jgi:hypothetical protein
MVRACCCDGNADSHSPHERSECGKVVPRIRVAGAPLTGLQIIPLSSYRAWAFISPESKPEDEFGYFRAILDRTAMRI